MSPRRLNLVNASNHACIANLPFPSSVLALRMNRKWRVARPCRKPHEEGMLVLSVMRYGPPMYTEREHGCTSVDVHAAPGLAPERTPSCSCYHHFAQSAVAAHHPLPT
jgi:hypothetical protein